MARRAAYNLALATFAFAVAFAVWSLFSPLAPVLQKTFALNDFAVSALIAVPVLLGSLLRIPMGILTDRWGGRRVFTALLVFSGLVPMLVPLAEGLWGLLVMGLFLGAAGSSFAIGVPFVSRWYPPEKQGFVLGIFGMGNVGTAIVARVAPTLVGTGGWTLPFPVFGALALATAALYWFTGSDAPVPLPPSKSLADRLIILRRGIGVWVLALYYFLTFGGFVAISVYLPKFLVDRFALEPYDAGLRAAGFVLLATLARPMGGWLADRLGGRLVLTAVFISVVTLAAVLALDPVFIGLSATFLAMAAALGLGNGAVFKLVAEVYPKETGTATGFVGAAGGLGGFFPPLLMGTVKQLTGSYALGWWGLAVFAALCLLLHFATAGALGGAPAAAAARAPGGGTWSPEVVRAATWGFVVAVLLSVLIVIGSRNLQHFDAALVAYTFATVFACFGIAYRYAMWLQRPPTALYWRRGRQLLFGRGRLRRGLRVLGKAFVDSFVRQTFIEKRSHLRWLMHANFFWGVSLAFAVTFPLVFGWIHFESAGDQMFYRMFVFGFPTVRFAVDGLFAFAVFHTLDISALMIVVGLFFSFQRRMRDAGALAVQQFANDAVPLILLFAIAITGLMLTVSAAYMRGFSYSFIALAHAITVILFLLYLPFGKFFHMFQRPAQLGVTLYKDAGAAGPRARCAACGEDYASQMHIDDLIAVEAALGFDYSLPAGPDHYQRVCPRCRRKLLALNQLRVITAAREDRA